MNIYSKNIYYIIIALYYTNLIILLLHLYLLCFHKEKNVFFKPHLIVCTLTGYILSTVLNTIYIYTIYYKYYNVI